MAKNVSRNPNRGSSGPRKRFSVFSWLDRQFDMNRLLGGRLPLQHLDYALWVAFLLLIYIGLAHHAEQLIRDTDKAKRKIEELHADYTTRKARFMKAGKQSEVIKKVAVLGLVEAKTPPMKLIVKTRSEE
ncbi:MAG: hypothetical protein LH606_22475 [Cytophagaceae bacterium]|nr:hypothetical protein [Cytophagaceae bacterium]